MSTIIAALDNSVAARPVLSTSVSLARLLDADVEAVHVKTDGADVVRRAVETAELPLRMLKGPVRTALLQASQAEDVTALVLGARGTPVGRRLLGSTALAVAASLPKPIVVVPPDLRPPESLRRALVPLEGAVSTSVTPRAIVKLARDTALDVVVLHVLEADSLPAFTDQPQHEQAAWAREFVRRYCPWGIGAVALETRVGNAEELVPAVAREEAVDLIAIGWSQELEPGRAPIVRATLARAGVPVMLVPVAIGGSPSLGFDDPQEGLAEVVGSGSTA